jgi:hypothetical protein
MATGDKRVFIGLNDGSQIWNVSSYVLNCSVNLGKNQILDSFQPGTATIVLKNLSREFDPTNTGSSFYGAVLPRATWVYIEIEGMNTIFDGWVDDWSFDYNVSGESTAILIASERTGLFARQYIAATSFPAELSGARVTRVLQDTGVNYTNPYNVNPYIIDAGTKMLDADAATAGVNALDYLNSICASEQGDLYTDQAGSLIFTDANYSLTSAATAVSRLFTDDGTSGAYPYSNIDISYSTDLLYNKVVVVPKTPIAVAKVTQNMNSSQETYQISELNVPDILYGDATTLTDLSSFLVTKYYMPQYRVNTLTVPFTVLDDTRKNNLLDLLDLNSFCKVKFTPNNTGSAIERFCKVIGIQHNIDVVEHNITFTFESLLSPSIVLDDAEFGKLDTYSLGF